MRHKWLACGAIILVLATGGCSATHVNPHKTISSHHTAEPRHEMTCLEYIGMSKSWQVAHGDFSKTTCKSFSQWYFNFVKTLKPGEAFSPPQGPMVEF